jgi:hypothetical protein
MNDLGFLTVLNAEEIKHELPDCTGFRSAGSFDDHLELISGLRTEDHDFEQEWFADFLFDRNDADG